MSSDEDPDVHIDDGLGNNRRYKSKHRHDLRLNYDSDSGDDVPKKKARDGDDDDMFASSGEEEEVEEKKPDTVELLDMARFEEEEGITGEQPDSDSEDGGPKIEAFNLRKDLEEGDFDADGNFIHRKVELDDEDGWIDEFSKKDVQKAKLAQKKRLEKGPKVMKSTQELMSALIDMLETGESPMEALVRLAPKKKKADKKEKKKDHMKVRTPVDENEKTIEKKMVDELTEICEELSNEKGLVDVYDMCREELMRKMAQETGVEYGRKRKREDDEDDDRTANNVTDDLIDKKHTDNEVEGKDNDPFYDLKIWEFRWLEDPQEIHGPYSTYEMRYWKESYFDNGVEVRKIGEHDFTHVGTVDFNE